MYTLSLESSLIYVLHVWTPRVHWFIFIRRMISCDLRCESCLVSIPSILSAGDSSWQMIGRGPASVGTKTSIKYRPRHHTPHKYKYRRLTMLPQIQGLDSQIDHFAGRLTGVWWALGRAELIWRRRGGKTNCFAMRSWSTVLTSFWTTHLYNVDSEDTFSTEKNNDIEIISEKCRKA